MIQKMSHATIYVLDQDQAKDFYVGKLGFEVKVNQSLPNGFRWLTVAPKGQSNFEIILMKGGEAGKSDTQDIDTMASLLKKGMFNAGAFQTADCPKPSKS
jgi:catechol 2,3-dioxygenase-like lactoylglutathione lyase family enzyme